MKKMYKSILIFLLLGITIVFIALPIVKNIQKVIIHNEIADKQSKYSSSTNKFIKLYVSDSRYRETYRLKDVIKCVDCNDILLNKDEKYITIYTPTQCIIYEDTTKTMLITDHKHGYNFEVHPIYDVKPYKKYNLIKGIFYLKKINVSTVIENGKECYKLEYYFGDEYDYIFEIYDKETGLCMKRKAIYENAEIYTYNFDALKEDDVALLNQDEYKILSLDEWKSQHYEFWKLYQKH